MVEGKVRVGGEGGRRGDGGGAERQCRKGGVFVGVAEEGDAVATAGARVRAGRYDHTVHKCR